MLTIRKEHLKSFQDSANGCALAPMVDAMRRAGYRCTLDNSGQQLLIRDVVGNQIDVSLGDHGLPLSFRTSQGRTGDIGWDSFARVRMLQTPGRAPLYFHYGHDGNIVGMGPEKGEYSFAYGAAATLDKVGFPDGRSALLERTANGQIRRLTAPDGTATEFDYDNDGRLTCRRDPLGRELKFRVTESETLIEFPDNSTAAISTITQLDRILIRGRDAQHTSLVLQHDGKLAAIEWPDGALTRFRFDQDRLAEVRLGDEGTAFRHDESLREETEQDLRFGRSVTARYDEDERLLALTNPFNGSVQFKYDADGLLETMGLWDGSRILVTCAGDGQPEVLRFPNGLIEERKYAPNGRPAAIYIRDRLGRALFSESYSYDECDRLRVITAHGRRSERQRGLRYDAGDRIQRDSDGIYNSLFDYDAVGNLRSEELHSGREAFSFGRMNEVRTVSGRTVEFDNRGNIAGIPGSAGTTRLVWDARGLLSEVAGSALSVRFKYDALGRRTWKQSGRQVWEYGWFGGQILWEEHSPSSEAERIRREYTYMPNTRTPVAFREGGRIYYCHTDVRGAMIRVSNDAGKIVWEAEYESFGALRSETASIRQPFRLAGQYEDTETGLYYSLARYYHPKFKTFLSLDPQWLHANATNYSYARNDPWNREDSTGGLSRLFAGLSNTISGAVSGAVGAVAGPASAVAGFVAGGAGAALAAGAAIAGAGIRGIVAAGAFVAELAREFIAGEGLCVKCAFAAARAAALAINPNTVLTSFAKALGIGLGIVTVSAVLVAVGVPSVLVVTALGGAGLFFGVNAYSARRKEIEATGIDISKSRTALYAAGDVLGISPLIEGFSGQRLGTGHQLLPEQRSAELGQGLGAAATYAVAPRFFPGDIVERAPQKGSVADANFAQRAIHSEEIFSNGGSVQYSELAGKPIKTVDDLAQALKSGDIRADQVPVDYVVRPNGTKLILNTRTSVALDRAGIPKSDWYGANKTGAPLPWEPDSTFDDDATARLQKNRFSETGTPDLPKGRR